jgi:hypothetical protein
MARIIEAMYFARERCQEKISWICSLSNFSGALYSLVSGMLFSPITGKSLRLPEIGENLK